MSSVALIAVVLLALGGIARAEADQTVCYAVKDSLKLKGDVAPDVLDLRLQPGCKLSKTRYLCVPARVQVSNVVDRKTGAIVPSFAEGRPTAEQVCYKIRCKRPFPDDRQADDQFGARTLGQLTPGLFCTPVRREPCDVCEGSCIADQVCYYLTGPSLRDGPECRCLPGVPCRDGTCPDGLTCERFSLDATVGFRECIPSPPVGPPCGDATAPLCDGACPQGFFCTAFGDTSCYCLEFAVRVQCGEFEGPPQCGGECPPATPICADVGGTCTCTAG